MQARSVTCKGQSTRKEEGPGNPQNSLNARSLTELDQLYSHSKPD